MHESIRHRLLKLLLSCLLICQISLSYAIPQSTSWFTRGPDDRVKLYVELYLSSKCPHCQKTDLFFDTLEKQYPWLVVNRYVINQDKSALKHFARRLKDFKSDNFSVPAIIFCDARWGGFDTADSSGKLLLEAFKYCREQIEQYGELNSTTIDVLRAQGQVSQFGIDPKAADSTYYFVTVLALINAFTPCSLFTFAAFLGFVLIAASSRKNQFIFGFLFILTVSVVQFLQQIALSAYFNFYAIMRWSSALIGVLFLAYLGYIGFKKKFSINYKSSMMLLPFLVAIATLVYMNQQTCETNVSLVFQQWLRSHDFTWLERVPLYLIYSTFYVLPLLAFLIVLLIVGNSQRFKRYADQVLMTAWFLLVVIGGLLVLSPSLFASYTLSWLLMFFSPFMGWAIKRFYFRCNNE